LVFFEAVAMSEAFRPPQRRFRVSIREIMALVGLAALACVRPTLIPAEVVAVLIWFAAGDGSEPDRARRVPLGTVLAALYLFPLINFILPLLFDPSGWSAFGSDWWSDWSPIFPIAPTAMPVLVVFKVTSLEQVFERMRPGSSGAAYFVLSSLATAALVYALTLLAGRSSERRAIVTGLSFFGSTLSSLAISFWIGFSRI
jgi:hypothetical protein